MPNEPELPEAVAWELHYDEDDDGPEVTNDLNYMMAWGLGDGTRVLGLYTEAQLTAHAEAVAAVRVREALDQAADYLVWESKAKGLPLDHEWVRGVWASAAHLSGLATEQVAHD